MSFCASREDALETAKADRVVIILPEDAGRLHFKGGIYRKLLSALDTTTGKRVAVYEHLWPHAHEYYTRVEEEFEDIHPEHGVRRFDPVR